MLRARDAMDRAYAEPLDIAALARLAAVGGHFIRTFKATFGETPHRYLQRRRVERAMFLLRTTSTQRDRHLLRGRVREPRARSAGRSCEIVGESPTAYRRRGPLPPVPTCFAMAWTQTEQFRRSAGGRDAV